MNASMLFSDEAGRIPRLHQEKKLRPSLIPPQRLQDENEDTGSEERNEERPPKMEVPCDV